MFTLSNIYSIYTYTVYSSYGSDVDYQVEYVNFILQRLRRHQISAMNHSLGCFSDCAEFVQCKGKEEHRGLCWCDRVPGRGTDGCESPRPVVVILGADEHDGPYLQQMGPGPPPPLLQKADVFSTHSLSALASSHLLGNMSRNKSKGLPAARLEGRHVTMKDEEAVCQRCAT